MPLKKVKQLIRQSASQTPISEYNSFLTDDHRPVSDSDRPPCFVPVPNAFPLVANSRAATQLYKRCLEAARAGRYVAVAGHKDDLLEAPSLFLRLADELGLARRIAVANGRESADLQYALLTGAQAVFMPTGRQLPTGVQHALADERFSGFGLLFILIAIPSDHGPEKALCPDLLRRCGNRVINWPAWPERADDHEQLVANAAALLGMGFRQEAALDGIKRRYYADQSWKTVGHMIKAMYADISKFIGKRERAVKRGALGNLNTLN